MTDARPQLSATMLDDLAYCGVRWQFRYGGTFGITEKNIVMPPAVPMAIGTAVHKAVEVNMRYKMTTEEGVLLPVDAVTDAARDEFCKIATTEQLYLAPDESFDIKKTIGQAIDQAAQLARVHYCDIAPKITPLDVERKFVISMPDYPFDLKGQIDLVEKAGIIRDTKTKNTVPPRHWPRTMQMAMYATAWKIDPVLGNRISLPAGVAIDCLVKHKAAPEAITVEAVPDETWLKPLFRRIEQFAQLIEIAKTDTRRVFTPAKPEDPLCSKRFCPFWRRCPYFSGKD